MQLWKKKHFITHYKFFLVQNHLKNLPFLIVQTKKIQIVILRTKHSCLFVILILTSAFEKKLVETNKKLVYYDFLYRVK